MKLNFTPHDVPKGNGANAREDWANRIAQMQAQQTGQRPDADAILDAMEAVDANDDEGQEDPIGNGEGVRQKAGNQRILRVDKRGSDLGHGNENRAEAGPQVVRVQAASEKELEKQVKAARKGKGVISETRRTVYEAIIVYE